MDHRLKWDLFRLPELECFDAMLNKLFKKELAELVMRFYYDIAHYEFNGVCLQVRGGEVQDVSGAGEQEGLHLAEQEHHAVVDGESEVV